LNGRAHGYEADLFHPGLGNKVVKGQIFLNLRMLSFQSDVITFVISLKHLIIEQGDEDDAWRICFRDRKSPEVRIFSDDQSVLNAESRLLWHHLERQATRRELFRRLRLTGYACLVCLLISWLGVGATHLMIRSLVAKVPPRWEESAGEEAIAEFKSKGVLLDDSNRIARLTTLAAPLLQVVPGGKQFKFHIMDSPEPNAFALPGGHIVVNSGLLKIADNDELLGVIAHESAHITQHHFARKIISSAGPLLIFGVFMHSHSQLINLLSEGSGFMVVQGFSQEYEFEADKVGWNYLMAANIDPRGMISIFRKFKADEVKGKSASELPQAFQGHPALDKRIARLEAKWNQLPRKSGFLELQPVDLRRP